MRLLFSIFFFSLFTSSLSATPSIQALSSFAPNPQVFPDSWRSCDGSGNNKNNPDFGQANTNKIRIAETKEDQGLLMGGQSLVSQDKLCQCAKAPRVPQCVSIYQMACVGLTATFCATPATNANIAAAFQRWCSNPEDLCETFGLPNPRTVSNSLFNQAASPSNPPNVPTSQYGVTSWAWGWGQFIDHILAAETDLATPLVGEHCKKAGRAAAKAVFPTLTPAQKKASCFQPIHIPAGDSTFTTSEMEFDRSPFTVNPQTNEREYLNIITSWLDASTVYGSSKSASEGLRDLSATGRGRLRTSGGGRFAPLIDETDFTIAPDFFQDRREFLFGDTRGNENRILTSVHTLWVREHNRVADLLWTGWGQAKWPICTQQCNDEIYQRARAWVIAMVQKITIYDWLPQLIGPKFWEQIIGCYERNVPGQARSRPQCDTYNSNLDPELTMEFTVAAFRIGHTLLNEILLRVDSSYNQAEAPLPLENAFFLEAQEYINKPQEITNLLRGLGAQNSNRIDLQVISSVRNMLFHFPSGTPPREGFDLVALNIQRGRDNGLARANRVRRAISRGPNQAFSTRFRAKRFGNFKNIVSDPQTRATLESLYKAADNVELFVAGLAEDHDVEHGARVGQTFGSIIADQFRRIRNGDRFWFENYLSPSLVTEVMNTRLADILERNLDGVNTGEIVARHPSGNVFCGVPDLRQLPLFNQNPAYFSPKSMVDDEELDIPVEMAALEEDTIETKDTIEAEDAAIEAKAAPVEEVTTTFDTPVMIGGALIGFGLVGVGLYFRQKRDTDDEHTALL